MRGWKCDYCSGFHREDELECPKKRPKSIYEQLSDAFKDALKAAQDVPIEIEDDTLED